MLLVMIILFLKYYSIQTHGQAKEAAPPNPAASEPKDRGAHTEHSASDMLASIPVG